MSSYTSVSRVAKLHYLVPGSTEESIVDLREIAIMLLADATANEVENAYSYSNNEPFGVLCDDFLLSDVEICETLINTMLDARINAKICEKFMCTMLDAGIDIEPELVATEALALKIIESIDAHLKGGATFEEMYKEFKGGAHREVLRGLGHGVSFWDDYRPEDFGQDELPEIGWFEPCYDEAYMVLTKLVAHREQNP